MAPLGIGGWGNLGGTAFFLSQVEATNTVTSGTATTVVEIHVSEQEPTSTGEPPGLADPRGGLLATGMLGQRPA